MPIIKRAGGIVPGSVAHFPTATAPAGWLKCNGAAVSRTAYAALFLVIGTTYGAGDGATTFNLPDLRGEFVRGLDDGRGVDAGRGVGTFQANGFAHHTHEFFGGTALGGATTGIIVNAGAGIVTTNSYSAAQNLAGAMGASGGGAETRPRNVAMLACIKY